MEYLICRTICYSCYVDRQPFVSTNVKIKAWQLIQFVVVPIQKGCFDQILAVRCEVKEVVTVSLTLGEASQGPSLLLKPSLVCIIDCPDQSTVDIIRV